MEMMLATLLCVGAVVAFAVVFVLATVVVERSLCLWLVVVVATAAVDVLFENEEREGFVVVVV